MPERNKRLRTLCTALALTVCAAALTGCVTGLKPTKDDMVDVPADPQDGQTETVAAPQSDAEGVRDPQVAAVAGQQAPGAQNAAMPAANAMMPVPSGGQPGSIILQTTGLKATSGSIFSSQPAGMIQPQPMPAIGAQPVVAPPTVDPASNSLFRTAPAQAPLPLQGASNGAARALVETASTETRPLPLQVAALGYQALPGIRSRSMFATVDDTAPDHDDASAVIEVAALPGLARLAPNGLWLQTENVEAGCFKPELMQMLKSVETHYGRKILVTSGMRDVEHNRRVGGRPQSLHTSCQAADIQVPGVSKWDLAEYLRALPGRGGVGTYCHTASVHIDTGRFRNWNWPCPRREA